MDAGDNGRDKRGRFAPGNTGGPGRPRRAVERDYLAALSDECGPDTWRRIVRRAVADAEAGDATARAWLGRYLLTAPESDATPPLCRLAAEESLGVDPVADEAAYLRSTRALLDALPAMRVG